MNKTDYTCIILAMIMFALTIKTMGFPIACDGPQPEDAYNQPFDIVVEDANGDTVQVDGDSLGVVMYEVIFQPNLRMDTDRELILYDTDLADARTVEFWWNETQVGAVYGDTDGNFIRAWATCESGETVRMECGR